MIPKLTKGICWAALLIVMTILAMASIPSAKSQQFSTSTSYLASPAATYYQTTTSTTYYGSSPYSGVLQGIFYDMGYGSEICSFAERSFNLTGGTEVSFSLNSTNPVTFYIMTPAQFTSVSNYGSGPSAINLMPCRPDPAAAGFPSLIFPALVTKERVTSFSIPWTAPSDGEYYWVLMNILPDFGPPPDTHYVVNVWSTQMRAIAKTTMTTTIPIPIVLTKTMNASEAPFTATYGGWIVATIIGVLVIAGLLSALRRRTTHGPKR